jgi:DNA topoisomerase-2
MITQTQTQIDSKYSKVTDIEHVLLRPGMYIGEIQKSIESVFTIDPTTLVIYKRNCEYSPGFLKLFDEILTNAIDYSLENNVTQIKVNINRTTGELSVWNNGPGIPIVKHSEHDLYIPELIFGHLRTGSNYNTDKSRVGGGVNGLGAKAVNIYSSKFTVETVDSGKKYIQIFTNNMSEKTIPKITKCSTKSYTKISWIPDYKRFNMNGLGSSEDDTFNLLFKRTIDSIISTPKNVKIYINDTLVKGNTLKDYINYYFDGHTKGSNTNDVGESESSQGSQGNRIFYDTQTFQFPVSTGTIPLVWEVAVVEHDSFEQVSFVNGLCTTQGGTHVKYISDRIISQLKELVEPKLLAKNISKDTFKPSLIRDKLFFFIRASIVNPRFNSQTKEYMTTPTKDFHCNYIIDNSFAKKIIQGTSILSNIIEHATFKQAQELKRKTDGVKRKFIHVPKLEDATFAGTSKSQNCTLLLTEGDSGKTFAMRVRPNNEEYGVFPLKGKVLNVRSATHSQLLNNEEINNLKQIIGLESGKVYTSTSSLRYSRIMLLTDADSDAAHIRSLIVNIFYTWWPSLLQLPKPFIITLRTPIVKATLGKIRHEFLTEQDYNSWKLTIDPHTLNKWKIHYYKGLGTSTKQDAQDIMHNIQNLTLEYYYKDSKCHDAILKAFHKGTDSIGMQYTDIRKQWLNSYNPNISVDSTVKKLSFCDMIDKELVHFSTYDNIRSIPHLMDGLKPSQRKIMYYCLDKIGSKIIKVAQLSGYVSAETAYHHGEASLQQAIIGLAQDFIGSNNLCLLAPEGNFGTRLKGGSDHASPRYIFTRLSNYTNVLFDSRDNSILDYLSDDGMCIEPNFFAPILPMILVNGSKGIGTGYSTSVPSFELSTIIQNIKSLLVNKDVAIKQPLLEMKPWFKHFKGSIVQDALKPGIWITTGLYQQTSPTKILITELPIGTWITDYIEFLKCLVDEYKPPSKDSNPHSKHPFCGLLKNVEYIKPHANLDENKDVKIQIEFCNKYTMSLVNIKNLKLSSSIYINNMYLFDSSNKLVKYNTPQDILLDYYNVRIDLYDKRKQHIIKVLEHDLLVVSNKIRFIQEYLSGILLIAKVSEATVLQQLYSRNYHPTTQPLPFDYLLGMSIKSLTLERINNLEQQCASKQKELDYYTNTTCNQLWLHDLEQLEKKIE